MSRNPNNLPAPAEPAPPWAEDLSHRERRFVEEYLIDLNAKEAAIRAGLGKTPKSASEIACRLRRKRHVAEAIGKLMNERTGTTGSRVIEELGHLAFSDFTAFAKIENGCLIVTDTNQLTEAQRACIAEVSETIGEHGRTIKIRLHDKLSAIDKLAKVLNMYKEKPADPRGAYDPTVADDVRKRLSEMIEGTARRLAESESPVVEIQPPARLVEHHRRPFDD